MAHTKHPRPKRHPKKRKAGTPESATAISAAEYHVPFWLLWGIAGAESTWGEGGTNLFGLLDAAEGVNTGNWRAASKQAAKTLAGLKKQYGSWGAAVQHYSGNSYTIAHPKELAASRGVSGTNVPGASSGVTPQNSNMITVGLAEDIFGGGAVGKIGENFLNPLHFQPFSKPTEPGGLEALPGTGGGASILAPFEGAANAAEGFFSLVTDLQFWIRAGEAVGGFILLYIALKALTGTSASDLPGAGVAKAVAFKSLPPRQKVSTT